GVDATLRLRRRHALHAVRAGLELQLRVDAAARDAAGHLAVAAVLAAAFGQEVDAPPLALGVARIHAEEVAREYCRLVAARGGADFEEDVGVVERAGRHE